MLEPGRQQVPCRVKSAGARVKRVIFGLGEAGRPDQQGPRRIEAPRSDIRRKPLGATLFGLGRLHRLDEQRVDERDHGRSAFSVLRSRHASRKGAEFHVTGHSARRALTTEFPPLPRTLTRKPGGGSCRGPGAGDLYDGGRPP